MEDKELKTETEADGEREENRGRVFFFVAIGATCAAFVFYGLIFVIGIYSLIASVLLSLGALAFLRAQKKKYDCRGRFAVTVIAYAALALSAGTFIGGIIYSAL